MSVATKKGRTSLMSLAHFAIACHGTPSKDTRPSAAYLLFYKTLKLCKCFRCLVGSKADWQTEKAVSRQNEGTQQRLHLGETALCDAKRTLSPFGRHYLIFSRRRSTSKPYGLATGL